ncbi:MAG: galactose mutarotase [Acidobacteriaceae bacterium]|nr:galactose mutarotase [Acidobacteriaceae bacterium]
MGGEVVVSKAVFGTLPDESQVEIFMLKSEQVEARVMSWGARLVSVKTKDRNGEMAYISLGYDTLEEWLRDTAFFGATVGRVANRIAGGRFNLDGQTFQVPQNNGQNALHGGPQGFDKKLWTAKEVSDGVELSLVSPDGDMGFPGTMTVTVTYTLKGSDLHIHYRATSDKTTVVNLTNHAYWNLRGDDRGDITNTRIVINADAFVPTDETSIPTGELAPVEGTPMDFRTEYAIADRADAEFEQLKFAKGYDHTWVLNGDSGTMRVAAQAYEPESGRTLTVKTTQPGMQFYSGNNLKGVLVGRFGTVYTSRTGFCFETQHFPDSPNHAHFPSVVLRPGEVFESETVYGFGVK